MSQTMKILFDRPSRTFHEGEKIQGTVELALACDIKHEGLFLALAGELRTFIPSKSALGNGTSRVIVLTSHQEMLLQPGKLSRGTHEIPFEVLLKASNGVNAPLMETYHGVRIDAHYNLVCEIRRGILTQAIRDEKEIFVEFSKRVSLRPAKKPYQFHIHPKTLETSRTKLAKKRPDVSIRGELDTVVCSMNEAIRGHLRVEKCSKAIKSVEVQLFRSELAGSEDAKDSSEVQNIQIADGDPVRSWNIPIHMVLPKLFASASVKGKLRIEFVVNILIILEDDHIIAESIPIDIFRH